jgi:predicted Zn-dependent peptidase
MPALPQAGPAGRALPNGLWLDVAPLPGTGVVALHLRLSAGSLHERPDGAGAAQAALESFLGEEDGLRADVRRLGGQIRGHVTRDATSIEVVVGSEQLGEALTRLAEQLTRRTLDAGRWSAIQRRLDTIQQQARQDDDRRATEVVVADLFDAHPLARAPMPDGKAIAELTPARINDYLDARYRPEGARLVVVGDVTEGDARSEASDALGTWLGQVPVVQLAAPTLPPELGLRMLGTVNPFATLAVAFPVDAPTPADGAQLDLVASLAETRLRSALLRAGLPADGVRVFAHTPTGGGFLLVRCRVPAEAVDAGWQALVGAVVADAGLVPSPDAYAEARRVVREAAAAKDVEGEARWRAALGGRWPEARLEDWQLGLGLADPDRVAERARQVLRMDRAAAVVLAPDSVRTDDDGPWVARLVEQAFVLGRPGAAPPAGVHRSEGLAIVLHPMPGATAVGLVARVQGGAVQVPAKRAGMAALVAAALAEPARGEPVFEVVAEADHLLISTEVLPDHLGGALEALERRLTRLTWDPARVEAARARALEALRIRTAEPQARLEALFVEAGRMPDPAGTEATLAELTPGSIGAWYSAHVREAPLTIALAGDVDTRLLGGLERRFGHRALPPTRPAQPEPTHDAGAPPPQRVLDGPHSRAVVGFWWPPQAPGPVLAAAGLELLAGLDGPLASALAEQPGAVAQPFLRLVEDRGLLGVRLQAPRDRFASARTALDQAIDKVATLPVDPEQLAAVGRRLATRARVNLRAPGTRARWLVDQVVMGTDFTGADALDKWSSAVQGLTPAEVAGFLRKTLVRSNRVEARVEGGAPVSGGAALQRQAQIFPSPGLLDSKNP